MSTTDAEAVHDVLLDWNESPLGPPAAAVARVVEAAGQLHRYPRTLMAEVKLLAAHRLSVSPEQILLTAGVDEAIDITLSLARRAWGVTPGFDGYPDRADANGTPFHEIPLGSDWQPKRAMADLGPGDIVFLAQPSNPTGNLFPTHWITQVRAAAQYVFIDETYQEFCARPSLLPADTKDPGLLVYRSFSKAMGLAGIRVGCLIGAPDVIARLEPRRRFMPIDAVSLAAAAGVLSEPGYVKRLVDHVLAARPALVATLRESDLFDEVRDTDANFVMARPRPGTAGRLATALARSRIWIKHCAALGLDGWMRVSVGSWEDQRRLGECLAGVATASDLGSAGLEVTDVDTPAGAGAGAGTAGRRSPNSWHRPHHGEGADDDYP